MDYLFSTGMAVVARKDRLVVDWFVSSVAGEEALHFRYFYSVLDMDTDKEIDHILVLVAGLP